MELALSLGLHPKALFGLDDAEVATVQSILEEWSHGRR